MSKQKCVGRVLLLVLGVLFASTFFSHKTFATTPTNQELSFEGKIVLANGTNIPNGTYNMEFKIYTGGSATGGGTLAWTEDYLVGGSGGITMTNGTFEVNLGAVNPFGSQVNWNAGSLYLSLQVGNTSACTISTTFQSNCGGDGEMSPYISLTSVPSAFNALELGGVAAANYAQLAAAQSWSGINTYSATGGNAVSLTGAPSNSGTSALLQVGNTALVGGNTSTSGGTYLALTEPSTGAGSAADFLNFQNAGSTKLQVDYLGDLTAAGTVKGAAVTATGALTGGGLNIANATYTSNLALINDGQTTAPPTIPSSYLPALTVVTSETSYLRPLFFGYNAGGSYGAYLDAGACGSFTTMCLDLGSGSTSYTALANNGTTLDIAGGSDGNFTNAAILASGGVSIGAGGNTSELTVNGTFNSTGTATVAGLTVTGTTTYSGGLITTYSSGVNGTDEADTVTNTNTTTTAATVNGISLALSASTNSNGLENTTNAINFPAITSSATGNTYNGLNFATGYTNLITSANFGVTAAGNITSTGTYNSNTFTGTGLTFGGSGATITNASGELLIGSANATLGITPATTTIQRVASGTTNLDLDDVATTTLQLENSGVGVANLNLYGGSLETGSTPVIRLTNSGALTNITGASIAGTATFANAGNTQTLLEVDGTNNYVQIGSETADATGTLLALDVKNTAGDPTAINGGMYYNSSTGNFRCAEAGTWQNCIGGLLSSNTAVSTAVTTCTTACPAFSTTGSLPANYCTPGRVIQITANGVFSIGTTSTLGGWGVYLGSNATTKTSDTLVGTVSPTSASITQTVTGAQWRVSFMMVCDTTTTVNGQGMFSFGTVTPTTGTTEQTLPMVTSGASTETLNSAQTIYLFPAFGTSAAGNTATVEQLVISGQ